jgi:hypothetical protein
VTACAVTKASGEGSSDATAGAALRATDPTVEESVEVLGDSAYGTGQMLAALSTSGHEPLVKPWPINPAVPGGFTVDDFHVNTEAGTVTCPNGVTRPVNRVRQVNFGGRLPRLPAAGPVHAQRHRQGDADP